MNSNTQFSISKHEFQTSYILNIAECLFREDKSFDLQVLYFQLLTRFEILKVELFFGFQLFPNILPTTEGSFAKPCTFNFDHLIGYGSKIGPCQIVQDVPTETQVFKFQANSFEIWASY